MVSRAEVVSFENLQIFVKVVIILVFMIESVFFNVASSFNVVFSSPVILVIIIVILEVMSTHLLTTNRDHIGFLQPSKKVEFIIIIFVLWVARIITQWL